MRIQGSVWESDVDVAGVVGEAMEAFVFGTTGSGSNFPFLFAWVLSAFCGLFAPRIRGILDVMAVVLLAQATFRRGAAFLQFISRVGKVFTSTPLEATWALLGLFSPTPTATTSEFIFIPLTDVACT